MWSRPSFLRKSLFSSRKNTGSPFSSYCFVSCIWGGLEPRTKKIYLLHDKSWWKWFKNASNIAEIGIVQTHRLTNGCFLARFPIKIRIRLLHERQRRERKKFGLFTVCIQKCPDFPILFKSGSKICDLLSALLKNEIRNFWKPTYTPHFCSSFLFLVYRVRWRLAPEILNILWRIFVELIQKCFKTSRKLGLCQMRGPTNVFMFFGAPAHPDSERRTHEQTKCGVFYRLYTTTSKKYNILPKSGKNMWSRPKAQLSSKANKAF